MNENANSGGESEYLGDPQIAIERAEDEETPQETPSGERDDDDTE